MNRATGEYKLESDLTGQTKNAPEQAKLAQTFPNKSATELCC